MLQGCCQQRAEQPGGGRCRDVRYHRDASGDDQNQRKDYCSLFYNRVASFAPNVAITSKVS